MVTKEFSYTCLSSAFFFFIISLCSSRRFFLSSTFSAYFYSFNWRSCSVFFRTSISCFNLLYYILKSSRGLLALFEPITKGGKLDKFDNLVGSFSLVSNNFLFSSSFWYSFWLILMASSSSFYYWVFYYKAKDIAIAFSIYSLSSYFTSIYSCFSLCFAMLYWMYILSLIICGSFAWLRLQVLCFLRPLAF